MELAEALLDSWDRQCRIVEAVASRVDETNRGTKPSEDGWPLDVQLAHIHKVRQYWLSQFAPGCDADLGDAFTGGWEGPIESLDLIRELLKASGKAIRNAVGEALATGTGPTGGYDHPVLFLQHMVWHEGWHVGLIFLGLRRAGQEPPEAWEEEHVWGEWRTEE